MANTRDPIYILYHIDDTHRDLFRCIRILEGLRYPMSSYPRNDRWSGDGAAEYEQGAAEGYNEAIH